MALALEQTLRAGEGTQRTPGNAADAVGMCLPTAQLQTLSQVPQPQLAAEAAGREDARGL